jgi:hypothetical protein
MAVTMKMAVFWVVVPCGLIALMMEAVQTSETLINSYQSAWHYNPEDSHLLGCSKYFRNNFGIICKSFLSEV